MTGADLAAFAKKQPVGGACLVVAIACGLALYFRSDAISVSQAEYEAKSAEASKMVANVKNAPGLAEQVAEIQELGKELEGRLIKSSQLAVNLQYFYKLEADHGVKLLDVRQNTPPRTRGGPKTIYSPVPFTLSAEGTYAQLSKFLHSVYAGRHLCRINSAVFTKGNALGAGGEPMMTLALNLELLEQP